MMTILHHINFCSKAELFLRRQIPNEQSQEGLPVHTFKKIYYNICKSIFFRTSDCMNHSSFQQNALQKVIFHLKPNTSARASLF